MFICVSELVMPGGDAGTGASTVLAPQLECCSPVDLNPCVEHLVSFTMYGAFILVPKLKERILAR